MREARKFNWLRVFVDAVCHIEEVSFCSYFVEYFYHEMLNFLTCFASVGMILLELSFILLT